MSARILHCAHLMLLAGWVGASLLAYRRLPERMPLHFGFGGTVDAWTRTSLPVWLLLPALGASIFFFGVLLERVAARTPEMWKLSPEEARRVRALPGPERDRLAEAARVSLARTAILATTALIGAHLGIYAAAVGSAGHSPWYAEALTWGSVAALLILAIRDGWRLRERVRATAPAKEAGEPG